MRITIHKCMKCGGEGGALPPDIIPMGWVTASPGKVICQNCQNREKEL